MSRSPLDSDNVNPDGIFRIARRTDFAGDEHIQRKVESQAELIAHCHTAAGKGQNETMRVVTIVQQFRDELAARLFTILESH